MKVLCSTSSFLAVRSDLYRYSQIAACFTQPRLNPSLTAEIQYIKRDTFGIFTPNNKNHWCERLWWREKPLTGGKEEGTKETKHAAWNKRRDSYSDKHTAHSFFTQLMLSFSPTFNSINKEQRDKDCYFCQVGRNKTKKHPASLTPQTQVNMWVGNSSLRITFPWTFPSYSEVSVATQPVTLIW